MRELRKLDLNEHRVIAAVCDGEIFKLWVDGSLVPQTEYVIDRDIVRLPERGVYIDVTELPHGEA